MEQDDGQPGGKSVGSVERCAHEWWSGTTRTQCTLDAGHEGPHSVVVPHTGYYTPTPTRGSTTER